MINIFEEAFKANVALNTEKLNESLIDKKLVSEAVAADSYETKFRQLLADSDNLTTGYFGEKDTEISDFGFRLYSQAAAIDVEFDPKTEKYSVKITDEEDSDLNEERTGRGFNELIAELEDLTSDGYTWFMNLENAFDYYKLDESLEEDVNEVEIKTDDEEIEIHIDDEGKVDVDVSEPTETDEVEDIEEIAEEEIISDDEVANEEAVDEEATDDEAFDEETVEEGFFSKKNREKTVALGTLDKGDRFSKNGYKYLVVRVDGDQEDFTVKPYGKQNPEDDVNSMGYVLMRGSDSVTKIEEGLFGKKKKPEQKSTSQKKAKKWQVYDCWDKLVVGEYDTKPEAEDSAASRGHDGRYKVQMSESKSIKESTNNKEFLKIDGFEHAITDTFEDEGYTGCNVVYTWHEKDIVEVEIWEQNDPVQVIDNLYAPNMMQSHYGDFDDFANDLQYKITRYMRESKSIKESVALDKIKFTESVDSFQPEDELMVVYNSDLDDEMTEEEIQAEAESLIGCDICKCGVCGANYVCKENEIPDAQDIVVIDEEDVEDGTIEEVEETEEDFNMEESLLFRHLKEAEGEEIVDEETVEEENEEETSTEETNAVEDECCNMVCPICGATDNQVLTATIAPIEDNLEDEVVEEEPVEEVEEISEPVEDVESVEELPLEDEVVEEELVTEDIGSEGIFVTGNELVAIEPIFYADVENLFFEAEDVEKFEKLGYIVDGKFTFPRGTKFIVGKEAPSNNGIMLKVVKIDEEFEFVYEDENDDRFLVTDVAEEISECTEETKETTHLAEATIEIDESSLNRLFTKFARENYENVVNVRINDGKLVDGQICLEGYVRTTSGVKRDIKLVSEGLNISENTSKVKIIEKGPFTEGAQVKSNRCPFVLECKVSENKMSFTGLKYNYIINESKESFSVSGKVSITE